MMVVEVKIGVQDLLGSFGCLGLGFFALLAFCLVPPAEAQVRYPVSWNQVETGKIGDKNIQEAYGSGGFPFSTRGGRKPDIVRHKIKELHFI
jgi:hypothetical protein